MGMALLAAERHWGLLNNVSLPAGLEVIAAVVALDFAIYLQHVLFHAVPALWRLHRVHHADLDFDVTTGARFHPIEIVLSMLIKFAVIAALGPAPLAVLIFEVLLNATAMFNHSNVRMPVRLDRVLRWLVVTPDMHRVHHSIEDHETNSNFGFNLPLWDRLFGTYKDQPDAGHDGMTIGIRDLRAPRLATALPGMLWLPFVGRSATTPSTAAPGEKPMNAATEQNAGAGKALRYLLLAYCWPASPGQRCTAGNSTAPRWNTGCSRPVPGDRWPSWRVMRSPLSFSCRVRC